MTSTCADPGKTGKTGMTWHSSMRQKQRRLFQTSRQPRPAGPLTATELPSWSLPTVSFSRRQPSWTTWRVIGVPQKMEGSDPVQFKTSFFRQVFGPDASLRPPVLDRAHRLGRVTDAGGKSSPKPRAFIVCFHRYQDKNRVLARRREELTFRGHRINIYPDLSGSLARQRAAFNSVKSELV